MEVISLQLKGNGSGIIAVEGKLREMEVVSLQFKEMVVVSLQL